jgi:hypothetical protein
MVIYFLSTSLGHPRERNVILPFSAARFTAVSLYHLEAAFVKFFTNVFEESGRSLYESMNLISKLPLIVHI